MLRLRVFLPDLRGWRNLQAKGVRQLARSAVVETLVRLVVTLVEVGELCLDADAANPAFSTNKTIEENPFSEGSRASKNLCL